MELFIWPCASHWHQQSVVPTCTRGQRPWKRSFQRDRRSFEVPAKESRTVENCLSLNLTCEVAFRRLNQPFGPTSGVCISHFSGGRIFKNALCTFESTNWRDWNCVSAIFRWSLLSGGRKERFDCIWTFFLFWKLFHHLVIHGQVARCFSKIIQLLGPGLSLGSIHTLEDSFLFLIMQESFVLLRSFLIEIWHSDLDCTYHHQEFLQNVLKYLHELRKYYKRRNFADEKFRISYLFIRNLSYRI